MKKIMGNHEMGNKADSIISQKDTLLSDGHSCFYFNKLMWWQMEIKPYQK